MKKITQEELNKILEEHQLWLRSNGKEGVRADLSNHDLSYMDFTGANLSGADSTDADFSWAIICLIMICLICNKIIKNYQLWLRSQGKEEESMLKNKFD